MLWYSKSRRSNGQKSKPLCTRLAVIAIRKTVCCWMTVRKQNACSSFLGTVSTATIFCKQCYRLNIRFDLTDKRQREIVERLQALDKKQYGSINKFVVTAVGKALDRIGTTSLTAEEVRRIIREELQEVTFVSEQPPQVQAVAPTLTKEEQAKNEQSVLDDLEMFG